MYERFTDRARKVMQLANQEAQRLNHEYIGTEHILLGFLKEGGGTGQILLRGFGVSFDAIRLEVEKLLTPVPVTGVTIGKLPMTPRAKKIIERAMEAARDLNHDYVGTEHILLGMLGEQEGIAAQVLTSLGVTFDKAREQVVTILGNATPQEKAEAVNHFHEWIKQLRAEIVAAQATLTKIDHGLSLAETLATASLSTVSTTGEPAK